MQESIGSMYSPNFEEFCELAKQGNLIPISREVLADLETPVSAFMKLRAESKTDAFLLESVEGGEKMARYSFVGTTSRARIVTKAQTAWLTENGQTQEIALQKGRDPLHLVQEMMARF